MMIPTAGRKARLSRMNFGKIAKINRKGALFRHPGWGNILTEARKAIKFGFLRDFDCLGQMNML